jgi:small subunit ribosomal protein S1
VRVKILEIDSERRRLSLSIKRVEGQVLPVRPITAPTDGDAGDLDDMPELGLSEDVFAGADEADVAGADEADVVGADEADVVGADEADVAGADEAVAGDGAIEASDSDSDSDSDSASAEAGEPAEADPDA